VAFYRYLYRGTGFRIGEMRCPAYDDLWSVECCEDNPLLGFPETAVWIENDGLAATVADSTRVMFHEPGRTYRRRLLDPRGYACSFIALDVDFFQAVAEEIVPKPAGRSSVTLPRASAPVDTGSFLHKIGLLRHLRATEPPDRLFIEEAALALLEGCLATGSDPLLPSRSAHPRTERDHLTLVEALRAELSVSLTENRSLHELARSVHSSPYHLARVFRRHTGKSIHSYRTGLRLRLGLQLVADPDVDIAAAAIALGFASHSHFTTSFGRLFRMTPSMARQRFARNRRFLREPGTIVKAQTASHA
jgi:AraC family transcriptional regulator